MLRTEGNGSRDPLAGGVRDRVCLGSAVGAYTGAPGSLRAFGSRKGPGRCADRCFAARGGGVVAALNRRSGPVDRRRRPQMWLFPPED
jgi:hypothetical protein